jgi:hypothetical protein
MWPHIRTTSETCVSHVLGNRIALGGQAHLKKSNHALDPTVQCHEMTTLSPSSRIFHTFNSNMTAALYETELRVE